MTSAPVPAPISRSVKLNEKFVLRLTVWLTASSNPPQSGMSQGFAGGGGLSTERLCNAVLNVLSLEEEVGRGTEGQPAPSQVLTVMHPHLNLTAPAHFEQR